MKSFIILFVLSIILLFDLKISFSNERYCYEIGIEKSYYNEKSIYRPTNSSLIYNTWTWILVLNYEHSYQESSIQNVILLKYSETNNVMLEDVTIREGEYRRLFIPLENQFIYLTKTPFLNKLKFGIGIDSILEYIFYQQSISQNSSSEIRIWDFAMGPLYKLKYELSKNELYLTFTHLFTFTIYGERNWKITSINQSSENDYVRFRHKLALSFLYEIKNKYLIELGYGYENHVEISYKDKLNDLTDSFRTIKGFNLLIGQYF